MSANALFQFYIVGRYYEVRGMLARYTPADMSARMVGDWENTATYCDNSAGEDAPEGEQVSGHVSVFTMEELDALFTAIRCPREPGGHVPAETAIRVIIPNHSPMRITAGAWLREQDKSNQPEAWCSLPGACGLAEIFDQNPESVAAQEYSALVTFVAAFDEWRFGGGTADASQRMMSARQEVGFPKAPDAPTEQEAQAEAARATGNAS